MLMLMAMLFPLTDESRLEGWKVGAGQMQSADGGARRAHAGSPVVVWWCTDRDPGQHRDA